MRFLSILGIFISLILLFLILSQLDWNIFIVTLDALKIQWVLACAFLVILGVLIRTLRWNTIAGHPLKEYVYFWKSMNLGYFANMIYPARAGEIVRMITIHRYVNMPQGKAISSVIIDRIFDGLVLGIFILFLLILHDPRFSWGIAFILLILLFVLLSFMLVSFILWGNKIKGKIFFFIKKFPERFVKRLDLWYNEAFDGAQALRERYRLFLILALSTAAFLIDSFSFYLLTLGFGWKLPFIVSIYLAIFIQVAIILPSAPGYVGIYQVACVLALRLFGIDDSAAIAYSLVLQVLAFGIFVIFGTTIAIRDGISPYKITNSAPPITKDE